MLLKIQPRKDSDSKKGLGYRLVSLCLHGKESGWIEYSCSRIRLHQTNMAEQKLSCESCQKIYKQGGAHIAAVRPATFTIESGINIIMGKSGSGKSTLLHMLAGLEIPTGGSVYYQDTNLYDMATDLSAIRRRHFGFIFQSYNLIPELTVQDNIRMPLYLNGIRSCGNICENLISTLGIANKMHQMPAWLSGGEQQRVAIARAIIHNPDVIFADEPTGNLDESNGSIVMKLLCGLVQEYDSTLVLVTHDKDLLSFADHVYKMRDGNLEQVA